jgi:type II secretory pathway pseudopilin PulG
MKQKISKYIRKNALVLFTTFQGMAFTACTQGQAVENASVPDSTQTLAFPGAEGFGKYTTGGRSGKVVVVNNLNDSGPGSLREALSMEEPRIVVFSVSGTIPLESQLDVNHGNLTIAGQSAPGEGISIRNYPLKVNAGNVIIRYFRSRMGDEKAVEDDGISIIRQKNIIVDHSTFSWGTDESASFYDNENFTLQWSIVSESLNSSVHKKGEHGYGGIWGGKGASFHHNLLAHHKSRNPRFNGARTFKQDKPELEVADFRNNVIYNWRANSAYAGEEGNYNMVNNYYKAGPATNKNVQARIVEVWAPYGNFYVAGNYVDGFPEVTQQNAKGVDGEAPEAALVQQPVKVVALPEQSAEEAYAAVLANAGASYRRDAADSRIVAEVRGGTATYGKENDGIIDSQQDVGGWPKLTAGEVPADKDGDGMPDIWENEKGLNPESPSDAAAYTLNQEYTNIEVYLNSLVEEEQI